MLTEMKFKLIYLLLLFCQSTLFCQINAIVDLQKISKLSIHGSTNLLNFTLVQKGDKILNKTIEIIANQQGNKIYIDQNKLSIKVCEFKSDNFIAEKEFYKMMLIEKYPNLEIELNNFELSNNQKNNFSKGTASLNITIIGVTRKYNFPIEIRKSNDVISISGDKKLTIKDFGIIPPTAMLGLVIVSEWIKINFDIVCKLKLDS